MSNEIIKFAETTYRNQLKPFGIKTDDRRRHMYLIGKTGMGKSTIQENMIVEDIRAGHGIAVIDPHGDLAEKVIEYIPDHRIADVIYFNPSDQDFPIAFNIVEDVDPSVRHLVASGLVGVFQKLWADSWGPRLEYILRNAILAVLDYPGSTLLSVVRMLSDKKFRKKIVNNIQNPVVKAFWVTEFAGYNDKFASEAVAPIQNKVGQFLSTTIIRNIIGQEKSSFDMRKIMDEKKILILNLSKGRIGEDNSSLLGNMMVTKIQLAAMSRVDIPEKDRKDFFLYVDEFQNFATDSFANILSEARKYRLSLILAHQYIEQLPETVRNAVFGNVGTIVSFRVGAADAEALAPEFFPTFMAEDILNLPKFEIYLKLMIDGVASEPFSARGLVPLAESEKTGNTDKIINNTRKIYSKSREVVEKEILDWHEDDIASSNSQNTQNKKNNTNQGSVQKNNTEKNKPDHIYKYKANCANCTKETRLPFEPDGVRPVYCTDCLSDLKNIKQKESEQRKNAKIEEIKAIECKDIGVNKKIVQPQIKSQPQPQSQIQSKTNSQSQLHSQAQTSSSGNIVKEKRIPMINKQNTKSYNTLKLQKEGESEVKDQLKNNQPEMSLSDAFQDGTVDFNGKKLQKQNNEKKNINNKLDTKNIDTKTVQEQNETRLINISNIDKNSVQKNNSTNSVSNNSKKVSLNMEENQEINF